jgi:hypothetical protein
MTRKQDKWYAKIRVVDLELSGVGMSSNNGYCKLSKCNFGFLRFRPYRKLIVESGYVEWYLLIVIFVRLEAYCCLSGTAWDRRVSLSTYFCNLED